MDLCYKLKVPLGPENFSDEKLALGSQQNVTYHARRKFPKEPSCTQNTHSCQVKCKVSKDTFLTEIPKLPNAQTDNFSKCMAARGKLGVTSVSHNNMTLYLAFSPFA